MSARRSALLGTNSKIREVRGIRQCPEAIQGRLKKPPKTWVTTATCLALVQADLKEAYLMAANLAGGKEGLIGYLKKQAELENPSAFMTGLSKLLPSMLEGNPDAPLIVERVYYTRDGDA
jgi:hypothetical protein